MRYTIGLAEETDKKYRPYFEIGKGQEDEEFRGNVQHIIWDIWSLDFWFERTFEGPV
jgi:hypothetical protein